MKIDLHVHSSERSACGKSNDEEQVRAAISAGLDGLFFTDHHAFIPDEKLLALNNFFTPFRIFSGIEISINSEDFLVLGIHDVSLTRENWKYPELHHFVRQLNGFIILAHPFRYHSDLVVDCENYRPDAIEICSVNTPGRERKHILELSRKWKIPTMSNSDAHSVDQLGGYFNILNETPSDEKAILRLLRLGCFIHSNRCLNEGISK